MDFSVNLKKISNRKSQYYDFHLLSHPQNNSQLLTRGSLTQKLTNIICYIKPGQNILINASDYE